MISHQCDTFRMTSALRAWVVAASLFGALLPGCSDDQVTPAPAADTTQDGSGDTASADTSNDSSTADTTDSSAADTVEQDGSGSGDTTPEDPGTCLLGSGDTDPDSAPGIGCFADYEAVSAPPLVESIPGARSAKTVIDRVDGDHLYIQNSRRYPIHWDFASTHLSGNGLRSFRSSVSSTRPSITPLTAASCLVR